MFSALHALQSASRIEGTDAKRLLWVLYIFQLDLDSDYILLGFPLIHLV